MTELEIGQTYDNKTTLHLKVCLFTGFCVTSTRRGLVLDLLGPHQHALTKVKIQDVLNRKDTYLNHGEPMNSKITNRTRILNP